VPAVDSVIRPRDGGHLDVPEGVVDALVGVSLTGRNGAVMLHLDVAASGDVEVPFSVGIPLSPADLTLVMLAARECVRPQADGRAESGGRPN
jgi:hypothetical protein